MDLPGLDSFIRNLIKDVMGSLFVAPNAFVLDVDSLVNGEWPTGESAQAVLLVKVYEARDLKNVEAIGVSDPYVQVKIGGKQLAKTRVVDNNLNPYFDESFYVLVNSLNDTFELAVCDSDLISKDKQMGSFKCSLADFKLDENPRTDDIWKPLVFKENAEK